MKLKLTILMQVIFVITVFGQQESTSSQYMLNPISVNPGYTGFYNTLSASAFYRFQSLGLEGAPESQTLSVHSPLRSQQAAVGLQIWNQSLAISRQTGMFFSYAYKIQAGKFTISSGLQGGLRITESNYTQLVTRQSNDPVFSENIKSTSPSFGAGIFIHNEKLFAGVSIPELIITNSDDITTQRPIIVMGGFVFDINEDIKVKPGGLLKITDLKPVELNINLSFVYKEILMAGAAYRPNNAVIGLIQFYITDQLSLGYTYDTVINDLGPVTSGSHEIGIQYLFRYTRKNVVSPRYF